MDFCRRGKSAKRALLFLLFLWLLDGRGVLTAVRAAPEDGRSGTTQMDGADGQERMEEQIEEYLDIGSIEAKLSESLTSEQFSFAETVRGLIRGELPWDFHEIAGMVGEALFTEIRQQKQMALQILIIVLASSVFSNFVRVFESNQIADISFYMMYLLIATLLVQTFLSMNQIVTRTCQSMSAFMKVLLPSYLVTVVFSAGTVSALGFYEITVLGMSLLQILIVRLVLPAINFLLILLILNQMSKEDYFSRLAELMETIIGWVVKTLLGIVIGLQAVQCLVAPAVDSLKNSAMHTLARAIPGIGSVIDSAAETVAGSAVVIKNAVGVAGMLALAVLCLVPLIKLLVCIFMFRFLCALIQPFGEKRMVECVASISSGATLLLRVLVAALSVFVISLAMITATVRGG